MLLLGQMVLAPRPSDEAMRRRWMRGHGGLPEWDVSRGCGRARAVHGEIELLQAITGWTFADNANTTGMFTGADTWLSRASRDDDSDTTDGPPGAWSFSPCLEDERVELGVCKRCTGRGLRAAGDDPAAGDTACAFPDLAALKTAVTNCLAVNPAGVACCSHGADCGAAAGTTEMADWDVSLVTSMRELFSTASRSSTRTYRGGHLAGHGHVPDVPRCRGVQPRYQCMGRPWSRCSTTLTRSISLYRDGTIQT